MTATPKPAAGQLVIAGIIWGDDHPSGPNGECASIWDVETFDAAYMLRQKNVPPAHVPLVLRAVHKRLRDCMLETGRMVVDHYAEEYHHYKDQGDEALFTWIEGDDPSRVVSGASGT